MATLAVATGQEIGITATFYDGDVLTDPVDPSIIVVAPDLSETVILSASLVVIDTGVRAYYHVLSTRGTWAFRVEATDPPTAYEVLVEATWGNTE